MIRHKPLASSACALLASVPALWCLHSLGTSKFCDAALALSKAARRRPAELEAARRWYRCIRSGTRHRRGPTSRVICRETRMAFLRHVHDAAEQNSARQLSTTGRVILSRQIFWSFGLKLCTLTCAALRHGQGKGQKAVGFRSAASAFWLFPRGRVGQVNSSLVS